MSFEHLFNKMMISGKPVEKGNARRSGKAVVIGYIEPDPELQAYWAPILEAKAKAGEKGRNNGFRIKS